MNLCALFLFLIFATGSVNGVTKIPEMLKKPPIILQPMEPEEKVSKHIKIVIEIYTDTMTILQKMPEIMDLEPVAPLESVLGQIARLEDIIPKLESYLQNMENGKHYDNEIKYNNFMTDINKHIQYESTRYATSLEKETTDKQKDQLAKERDHFLQLLERVYRRRFEFEQSVEFLKANSISLRPEDGEELEAHLLTPEAIDISVLQELMNKHKVIELANKILQTQIWEKNKSEVEMILNARTDLIIAKLSERQIEKVHSKMLRKLVPVVRKMRNLIFEMISEAEKKNKKKELEITTKTLKMFLVNQRILDLMDKIHGMRDKQRALLKEKSPLYSSSRTSYYDQDIDFMSDRDEL